MGDVNSNAVALGALEQMVKGWVREVMQEERAWLCRELDRREQYGAAREILADVLPPEEDEIPATVAAKLLGLSTSNTLLQQMRREGGEVLRACLVPGKEEGKARRFSRAKIKALRARRAG